MQVTSKTGFKIWTFMLFSIRENAFILSVDAAIKALGKVKEKHDNLSSSDKY